MRTVKSMSSFKFKKKYGQNFLTSETISDKIVDAINPTEEDLILEIGPGGGALTKKLKKYNCPLIAFEIDREVEKYLSPLEDEKTRIVYEDFLSADIISILRAYHYQRLFIIGNLPYYITTPILDRIVEFALEPEEIVIMVQKEVADRFMAKPKTREYGYMTVLLNYHYNIKIVTEVGRKNFRPVPAVDSAVLKLSKKAKVNLDYDRFKQLLKDSFQFKRKTINNNLKNYDLAKVQKTLRKHGYDLSSRAEELDLETFIDLTNTTERK